MQCQDNRGDTHSNLRYNSFPLSNAAVYAIDQQHRRSSLLKPTFISKRLPRHLQSPTYVDPRAAQGLETPPRTSTSHLASDPKCRPPSAQPRTLTQHGNLPRTENDGGNSWKRLRSNQGLACDDDDNRLLPGNDINCPST